MNETQEQAMKKFSPLLFMQHDVVSDRDSNEGSKEDRKTE